MRKIRKNIEKERIWVVSFLVLEARLRLYINASGEVLEVRDLPERRRTLIVHLTS